MKKKYLKSIAGLTLVENLIGIESLSEITDKLKARLIQAMIRAGEEAPNIVSANKRPSKQYEMSPELGEL